MTPAFEGEIKINELSDLVENLLSRIFSFPNVCLHGDLGAGKTTLIKELCKHLGIDPKEVTSPTFAYMQTYKGGSLKNQPIEVHHFDLYRLESEEDFESMGWCDYFLAPKNQALQAITLIEWPSRITSLLPKPRLDVELEYISEESRKVSIYERV